MRKPARLLAAALVGLFTALPAALADEPGRALNLTLLRSEGRIEAVLWTRRTDHYTLQVVFPRRGRISAPTQKVVENDPDPRLAYPDVRVWVLKADGTVIPPLQRLGVSPDLTATPVPRGASDGNTRIEVMYRFPLSAGTEAVAIAVAVDGEHRIQQVTALGS